MVNKMLGVSDYFPSCPHRHPLEQPAPWNNRQRHVQKVGPGPRACQRLDVGRETPWVRAGANTCRETCAHTLACAFDYSSFSGPAPTAPLAKRTDSASPDSWSSTDPIARYPASPAHPAAHLGEP